MRYDKALYAPQEEFLSERVDLLKPKDGQKVSLFHMRPSDTGVVCGEGYSAVLTLPVGATRLYVLDDGIYAYEQAQKALYNVISRSMISGIASEPRALLPHATEDGTKGMYCVEGGAVRYLRSGTVQGASTVGGDCAAMHHGRLFVASGTRLRFSAPFSTAGLLQAERDPDGAGYIDFEDGKGSILALVPFRGKLYLLFERGIMRMRAEGEALDFGAAEMPFRGGKILRGSVADVGNRICYMTQDGLFSYDGSCDYHDTPEEVDLSLPVSAYACNGKYAAAVTLRSGKKALYLYDFARKERRYLLAEGLLAGDGEYFLAGAGVYRLTERGLPLGEDCSAEIALCSPPRALAWVRVEGEGQFELRIGGIVYPCEGGEKVNVGGREKQSMTQIGITAKSADFRIRALGIAWRKKDGD